MITAVDTSVLLDVFTADPKFGRDSRTALGECLVAGTVLASDVVWAETVACFPALEAAEAALATLGVRFSALEQRAAGQAALAWRHYRKRGGPHTRVISDFLVGAHASAQADRLLTRDRGFYRSYFGALTVLDPTDG